MDKLCRITILNDLYGGLLTEKQQEVLELFYNQDFSLGEIGEFLQISRQAVHDNIQRSEKMLEHYEEKLGLLLKLGTESSNNNLIIKKLETALAKQDWQLVQEVVELLAIKKAEA